MKGGSTAEGAMFVDEVDCVVAPDHNFSCMRSRRGTVGGYSALPF